MTQTEQIRAHLESGQSITPLQALSEYGCLRLGARIYELRREGMAIARDLVTHPRNPKKHFARYRLGS